MDCPRLATDRPARSTSPRSLAAVAAGAFDCDPRVWLILAIAQPIAPLPRVFADVDEAKLARFGGGGLLRWQNIEGVPYWVAGAPLEFEAASQLHAARLIPGGEVLVHLPSGSLLRVAGLGGRLQPQDVQLWVSNGSGLYRAALSAVVTADGSLLLAASDLETSLVRIVRPTDRATCLDVALFISRRMVPKLAFPYPCEWVGCGPPVTVTTDGLETQPYRYLVAGQAAKLFVASPARLRIESRLEYSPLEAEAKQIYQLQVRDGDRSLRVLPIHTRQERHHVVTINGVLRTVGQEEIDYVDIPAGVENVEIQSSASTYLRITAAPCRSAYPAGWLNENDPILAGSIWSMKPDDVLAQLAADDYPATRRWRIAQAHSSGQPLP